MGIARYLSKLASGLSSEGVIPASKGGTGTTTGASGSGGPKISNIVVTNSSYTNLDDTAVDVAGGYIKVIGTGFAANCQVLIGTVAATSVTFVSDTEVRAQLPATAAGTYIVYLVNSDGGVAIRVNGVTFSTTPTWTTQSALENEITSPVSIQLAATGASTFSVASGSALPSGITLSSSGLLSGSASGLTEGTTYNFTINATDTELQDSPRTFALTITVAADPNFKYTSLLLSGNGTNNAANNTFTDSSTNNVTVTRNGNTAQGIFSPYGNYWSNYFDGTGDYLTPAANGALAMGTSDFTFEAWIYITAFNTWHSIVSTRNTANTGNQTDVWCLGFHNTGYLYCYSGNFQAQGAAGAITLNTWHHVAISRSGSSMRLFVNGVQTGTTGTTSENYTDNSLTIGANGDASEPITGYISNARLVKGTALYTANFTPSTQPLTSTAQTSLLTCQSNRLIDTSTNNLAITKNGDVAVQRFSPFAISSPYYAASTGGSAYFDGTADNLLLPYSAGYNLPADFTIELWYYPTDTVGQIINCGGGSGIAWASYELTWLAGQVVFAASSANTGYDIGSETTSAGVIGIPKLNQWNHIAVTRTGNTYRGFVNGILGFEQVMSVAPYNQTTRGLSIGANYTTTWGTATPTSSVKGYISDVRIVKGTSLYTGSFTPPAAPLTAVTNTQLLLKFGDASIVDATAKNVIETFGNAKLSTTQYKFGTSSMYFEGSDDYLKLASNNQLNLGTEDFTIEYWAYFNSLTNIPMIFHKQEPGGTGWFWQIGATSMYFGHGVNSGTQFYNPSIAMSTGTWYHLAATRVGNTISLFINGVKYSSNVNGASNSVDNTYPFIIGGYRPNGANYDLNGYIDDFRVTKGVARYTANFTPPTQTFAAR